MSGPPPSLASQVPVHSEGGDTLQQALQAPGTRDNLPHVSGESSQGDLLEASLRLDPLTGGALLPDLPDLCAALHGTRSVSDGGHGCSDGALAATGHPAGTTADTTAAEQPSNVISAVHSWTVVPSDTWPRVEDSYDEGDKTEFSIVASQDDILLPHTQSLQQHGDNNNIFYKSKYGQMSYCVGTTVAHPASTALVGTHACSIPSLTPPQTLLCHNEVSSLDALPRAQGVTTAVTWPSHTSGTTQVSVINRASQEPTKRPSESHIETFNILPSKKLNTNKCSVAMKLSKPSSSIDSTDNSSVFDVNNPALVMSFPVTDASLISAPTVTDCSPFPKMAPLNGRRVPSTRSVPPSDFDIRTETHVADYCTTLPAVYRAEPLNHGYSGYNASVSGDVLNCPRRIGEPCVRGTLGNNGSVSGEAIAVSANNDRACDTDQSLSKSPGVYQENKSLHSTVSRLPSGTKNISLLPTQSLSSSVMSSHFVTIDGSADLGFQEDSKVFTIDKDSIHISQDSPDLLLSEMNLVPLDDDFSSHYPSDGGLGDLHAFGDGAVAPDIFAVNGVKTAFITSQGPFTTLPHCTSFFLDNSNLSIDIDGLYDDDICANLGDADALEKMDSPQKKGTANTELTFSHVFKSVSGKKPEKDVDMKVSLFEAASKTAPFPATFDEKPFINDPKAKMLSFKNIQQTKVKIEEQLCKKDLLVQQVSCFQCKLCSFLAVEKSSMQDHMKENHQEYLSDTEESDVDEQILKTKRVKVFMPRSGSCQAAAFTEALSKASTEEEHALQNIVSVPKIKTRVFHSTSTSKKTHHLDDQGPVHKKIKIVHVSDISGSPVTNTFADIENTTLMKPITSVSAMVAGEASSDTAAYRKVKMVLDGQSRGAGTSAVAASPQQGGRSSRKAPSIKSGRPMASKSQGIAKMKKMCKLEQSEEELFGYKCDIGGCGLRVRSKENLEYHRRCHTDDGGAELVCPECQTSVSRWRLLATHLWREHRIDIDLHRCQHCNFRCYSLSRLHTSHLPSHSNERPFLCETCGKVFKTSKQLRYHKTASHSGQTVTGFTCTACNKQFVEKRLLLQHMDVLHNNVRRHLCSYCGKAFGSSNTLNLHLRTHTGEKPFACLSCSYRTSDHNSLRRHLMQHSKLKPYRCPYCPYSAIQSTSYKVHLAEKHTQQAVADNLLFSCQHCKFMSVRHDMYRSHLATKHNITMPPCAPPVVSRAIFISTSGGTNVTNTSSIDCTTVNNITSTVASCASASNSATSNPGNPIAGGNITVSGVMQRAGYASDVMLDTVASTGSLTDTITGPVILTGLSSGTVGASSTSCRASAFTTPLTIPATFVITANTRPEEQLPNTTQVSKVVKIVPALKATRGPGVSGTTCLTGVAASDMVADVTDGAGVSAGAMEMFAVTERSSLGLRSIPQAAQTTPFQRASFRPGTIFYSDVLLEEIRGDELSHRQQQTPVHQQLLQQTLPVQQLQTLQPQQTLLVQQQTVPPMQQLTLQPVQQQRLQEHLQQQRLADQHHGTPKIQRVTLQQHHAHKQQSEQQQQQHQQNVEQRQPTLQQQRQKLPSQRQKQTLASQKQPQQRVATEQQQQRHAPRQQQQTHIVVSQKQPQQRVATEQQQQRHAPRQQQQTHIVVSQKQQKCTIQPPPYKLLPLQQQQILLHQQQRLTPQHQKQHQKNVYIIP